MNHNQLPIVRTLGRLRSAFWQRRIARWLIRAIWLALLVPTVVMAGYIWLEWQVPWNFWLPLMVVVGICAFIWSLRPIDLKKMARRLDDLLRLRAQLVTAFEVSHTFDQTTTQAENPVVEQLIQNSVNITVDLRRQVNLFERGFWLEMQALIAIAAVLGAMLVFDTLIPNIPTAPPVELPPAGQEPLADQVFPPSPKLQPPPISPDTQDLSNDQSRSALQILADALRDQAVTRSIADAIDRNDLGQAAAETRRLADQLNDLSEDARRQLGDNLQKAADNIGDGAPNLTEPLEKGNQALDAGNLMSASQALEELAEVLDSLDETMPESNQPEPEQEPEEIEPLEAEQNQSAESDNTAESQPPEEDERLPVDDRPFELESDPDLEDKVLQPSELGDQSGEEGNLASPFTRQSITTSSDELGPDPLIYPWEKRDVIRQYFTP